MPSPDGSRLAYSDVIGRCESTVHVVAMDPDSGSDAESALQVKVEGVAKGFAWSPAGDRLAFVTEWPDGKVSLRVLDVSAGTVSDFGPAGWGRTDGSTIHWSEHGQRLAYYMPEDKGIRIMNVEDRSVIDISVDDPRFQFVLSPSGDSIFVSRGRAGGSWIASVADGQLHHAGGYKGWLLAWRGDRIVYWGKSVFSEPVAGGPQEKVADLPECAESPSLAFTRDLRTAVCAVNEMVQDLWVVRGVVLE